MRGTRRSTSSPGSASTSSRARASASGNGLPRKRMRVTVCELPDEPEALSAAWAALCEHTIANESELVLLPEFAFSEPVWELECFDAARWTVVEALSHEHLGRLPELRADYVVATRP